MLRFSQNHMPKWWTSSVLPYGRSSCCPNSPLQPIFGRPFVSLFHTYQLYFLIISAKILMSGLSGPHLHCPTNPLYCSPHPHFKSFQFSYIFYSYWTSFHAIYLQRHIPKSRPWKTSSLSLCLFLYSVIIFSCWMHLWHIKIVRRLLITTGIWVILDSSWLLLVVFFMSSRL